MTKRKQDILREATRLFAESGFEGVSVAQIAKAAEVSQGAVFRHFPTKETLLRRIFQEVRESFLEEIERDFAFSAKESGREMVLRLALFLCRFYEKREVEFEFIHRNNPYRMPEVGEPCREEIGRIQEKMSELLHIGLSLGVRDGSIREMDVERGAILILGGIGGTVRQRLFMDFHLQDLEADLIAFMDHALRP
ncbi:TetR/AcrR family transcriptional regulator [Desulfovibrio sp.]